MKYKLTDETIELCGRTLHRIECVEAFADVKVGDKGGYMRVCQKSQYRLSAHSFFML